VAESAEFCSGHSPLVSQNETVCVLLSSFKLFIDFSGFGSLCCWTSGFPSGQFSAYPVAFAANSAMDSHNKKRFFAKEKK